MAMETAQLINITSNEATMATAAVMGALYATYGEDPLDWKKMDASDREVIETLQHLHGRLQCFLDPWGVSINHFTLSVPEARLLRLSFRIFSNVYPQASRTELQALFQQLESYKIRGAGLLPGLQKLDARLASVRG